MKGESNRDWYCSANSYSKCKTSEGNPFWTTECDITKCKFYHRKWPTPEQFKGEYGEEYPDDGAVYYGLSFLGNFSWEIGTYKQAKDSPMTLHIVCACTPWGRPPNSWRPE